MDIDLFNLTPEFSDEELDIINRFSIPKGEFDWEKHKVFAIAYWVERGATCPEFYRDEHGKIIFGAIGYGQWQPFSNTRGALPTIVHSETILIANLIADNKFKKALKIAGDIEWLKRMNPFYDLYGPQHINRKTLGGFLNRLTDLDNAIKNTPCFRREYLGANKELEFVGTGDYYIYPGIARRTEDAQGYICEYVKFFAEQRPNCKPCVFAAVHWANRYDGIPFCEYGPLDKCEELANRLNHETVNQRQTFFNGFSYVY